MSTGPKRKFAIGKLVVIVETLVTTIDRDGLHNLSPMGPHIADPWPRWTDPSAVPCMTLRPFAGSQTHRNLTTVGEAVIHFCDDVELFAASATRPFRDEEVRQITVPVGSGDDNENPAGGIRRLKRCQQFFHVRCEVVSSDEVRPVLRCSVLSHGVVDPGGPLHRAAHAVIEAAILATRLHLIDSDDVTKQLRHLAIIVDKTADRRTRAAFDSIVQFAGVRLETTTG